MSAFEVISKEEFDEASGSVVPNPHPPALPEVHEGQLHLEWCEFCRGWFIKEFHHGEEIDE